MRKAFLIALMTFCALEVIGVGAANAARSGREGGVYCTTGTLHYPCNSYVAEVSDMGSALNGTWTFGISIGGDGIAGNFRLYKGPANKPVAQYAGKIRYDDHDATGLPLPIVSLWFGGVNGIASLPSCTVAETIGKYSFTFTASALNWHPAEAGCGTSTFNHLLTGHAFKRAALGTNAPTPCATVTIAGNKWFSRAQIVPCSYARTLLSRLMGVHYTKRNSVVTFPGTYSYPNATGPLTCTGYSGRFKGKVTLLRLSCRGPNRASFTASL